MSPTTLASISPSFSKEQEDCYKQRYTEGYDLMDPEYLHWLEIYHPEARYSLETAPSSTPFQASSSVAEHFSPLQVANMTGSSTAIETSSSIYIHESHEVSVVAKFLTPIPIPSRPVKRSSGARILTS